MVMTRFAILAVLLAMPAAAHDVAGAPHAHPHIDPNLLMLGAAMLAVFAVIAWRRR
jgi:hypothetical protein